MSGLAGLFTRAVASAFVSIIVFLLSLPITSSVAVAQQVSGKILDEVTVTVRRREETVKDVPATVYVFSEQAIERSNITRAGEIALLTPGVSLVDAAEVGDTQVNIRGMNGARDAENSYGLVVDGIILTNPGALNREYANLQQIAVLKGPQGAIYGRNASAGAFVITTKKPGEELGGSAIVSAAEDASYRLVGVVDGPLSDTLGGTLSADYRTTDGFYKNTFLNRDDIVDNVETWSVSGRLLWEPNDKLAIDAKARYGEVDASSIAFNNTFALPGFAGVNPAFYEDVNKHVFDFYSNIVHFNDQESSEFSIKLDWDLEWATLTTWGLYSDIQNQLGADGTSAAFSFFDTDPPCANLLANGATLTGYPLNAPQYIGATPGFPTSLLGAYTPTACDGTQYQKRDQKDISFEARLTSPGDEPFRWNAGLYYLNIDREVAVNTGIDRLNAPSFTGAKPIARPYVANVPGAPGTPGQDNPTEQLAWDDFDTDVYSVFGGVAYDFAESWTVDFALRYDREERKVTNKVPFGPTAQAQYIDACNDGTAGGVLNPGQCNPSGAVVPVPGPIPPKSKNFDEWQPKLSLVWDTTDQWTLFGSVGLGFRSGGFNNSGSKATVDTFINTGLGLCDPAVPGCVASGLSRVGIQDEFAKETATAAELGFKSTLFENKVSFEGAAYYTKVDDMQFFEFIVGGFGLLRVVENIDEVEIMGLELAATWNATDWLDLFIGGNWTDSEIKKNSVRPDTVGNDSPYTPEYTANLGAYVKVPVTKSWDFFTNLDVSTIGDTWFHVVQAQTRPTGFGPAEYSVAQRDAYTLANIRFGMETDSLAVGIFVTNLTDEDWLEEVIPAPEFGGTFSHVGTQRRIGADLTWRF